MDSLARLNAASAVDRIGIVVPGVPKVVQSPAGFELGRQEHRESILGTDAEDVAAYVHAGIAFVAAGRNDQFNHVKPLVKGLAEELVFRPLQQEWAEDQIAHPALRAPNSEIGIHVNVSERNQNLATIVRAEKPKPRGVGDFCER